MSEAAQAISVDYREEGRAHEPFQHLRMATLPFAEVLDCLRAAIRDENLLVLHEIDPQTILQSANHVMGQGRQILFFHPRLMARLLEADTSALLEAPLKIAVIAGSGAQVSVRWQDPAGAFARYDNPALAALGSELAQVYERIITQALGAR